MAKWLDGLPTPEGFRESLRKVLEHFFGEARRDYHGIHEPDHIYLHLDKLSLWMCSRRYAIVSRRDLVRLHRLCDFCIRIMEADQDDADGCGEWDGVYDDAREAARRLFLIREHIEKLTEEKPLPAKPDVQVVETEPVES
jgi:hypothetical protein